MSHNYHEELPDDAKKRYEAKLDMLGFSECPYKLAGQYWSDEPEQWPHFGYGDMWDYLMKEPHLYTKETMIHYKSMEAYKFFNNGWVQTVLHIKLPSGDFLFRADVTPSPIQVNNNAHHPWIAISPNCSVITAHCDCEAGLAETCAHIAGMMFKMELLRRQVYHATPDPEEHTEWNSTFSEDKKPVPICEMSCFKSKSPRGRSPVKIPPPTAQEMKEFYSKLAVASPNAVILSVLPDYADRFVPSSPNRPTSEEVEKAPSTSEEKNSKCSICEKTTNPKNMVGCDRCKNSFHLGCIKLKRLPRAKTWYCKPCCQKNSKKGLKCFRVVQV